MFKIKGNRLRFLGQTPGGLDPSDTIMSTRDTITSTIIKWIETFTYN